MVAVLLLAAAMALALLWAGQRSLLYLPMGAVLSAAEAGVPDAEEFPVVTSDGLRLGSWFVRSRGGRPLATVIVFNGNAGNRSDRAPLARRLSDAGFQVCLFDYRGYGGNKGSPSEAGLLRDAHAVGSAVARRPDVDASRIVLLGESLGTGVAVALAAEVQPMAVVLRSPFTSIADVAARHYWFLPVRQLLWDRYDSLSRIGALTCPVAIVAGDRDGVVPFGSSQQLHDAVHSRKIFLTVHGADHNDFELCAGGRVVDAVRWAVEQAGGTSTESRDPGV
jgi:fermentation-respiration switch protein FrsA (DUF1100 family)